MYTLIQVPVAVPLYIVSLLLPTAWSLTEEPLAREGRKRGSTDKEESVPAAASPLPPSHNIITEAFTLKLS